MQNDERVNSGENVNEHDLFINLDDKKIKLSTQISPIYATEEYYTTCLLKKGNFVSFSRGNGSSVPVREQNNSGYTLVGKAKALFKASKALVANGETSDDQEYVYVNLNSRLEYVGDTAEHSIYVRVYDNANGNNNDRWVVISII